MSTSRFRSVGLGALLFACGCATAAPPLPCPPGPATGGPAAPAPAENKGFRVLPEEKSAVTFDRMSVLPEPGWAVPRSVGFAPDKKSVVYLASENGSLEMALFAFDLEKKTSSVLLRAKDLLATDKPLSREEELRRERMRERATGISSYVWAEAANAMVVPLGGDLFFRGPDGKSAQLTRTAEPEIDPKLCKTGERVVFVRGRELFAIDTGTGKETQLTKGAPDGVTRGQSDYNGQEEFDEPSGFWISPGCDKVAYLEVDEREVAVHPVLGYRGKKPDLMEQRYPAAGEKNPKVKVGILDIKSKKSVSVSLPGDKGKERYLGRFAWAPDGSALFFQALDRDQKRLALMRADSKAGAATEIAVETSAAWVDLAHVKLLERSNGLLWLAPRNGHNHIESRDRATGKVIAQITQGSWDVTEIEAIDEERETVYFTGTKDSPVERHLYRVSLKGGEPVKITAERGVHSAMVSARAGVYVDIHSALDRPPQAAVRDLTGAIVGSLPIAPDKEIESLKPRAPEIVTLKAESGDTLYGSLLKPRTVEAGVKYPVVVMVYGGPGVQTVLDRWGPSLFWQHLADRGFVVFQVDNRGSAGRGPAFEQQVSAKLGTVELQDQLAGVEYLKKLPFVDGGRIAIYGHSYGGFMAALAMLKAPGAFKVGVAAAPVTEWRLYDTGYTERYMGTPAGNAAGYEAADLTKMAKGLTGKLLVMHALMDENVHFQHTADLVDALVAEGKPFDLHVFPGERHGYRSPPARKYALRKVASYLAEHL